MSFPRYPKYKDSGVEWLGEVPEHWNVKQIRTIATVVRGASPRPAGDPTYFGGDATPWVTVAEITKDDQVYLSETESFLTEEGAKLSRVFEQGTVIYSNSGATLGVPKILAINACANDGVVGFEQLQKEIHPHFLYHYLSSITDAIREKVKQGSGQPNLNTDIVKALQLGVPPFPEQVAISRFLTCETAKIDELIAEQQRLIELLKKKRQAVISHAVTKGLNPHAPLKVSGIEWFGDVPAHWDMKRIKFIADIGNGSTPSRENPDYWESGTYPWLNSSVVNQTAVTESTEFVTCLALKECHLPKISPPAVLVGITGQGRTRGMASTLLFEATINQHVAFLKPNPESLDVNFLRRIFEMAYDFLRAESDEAGSTKGAITCDQLANLKIPTPPISEQLQIIAYLDNKATKFDDLTTEAQLATDLLQERRTALISAAVTGKIDVRDPADKGDH